jgi:hypothetical protein
MDLPLPHAPREQAYVNVVTNAQVMVSYRLGT